MPTNSQKLVTLAQLQMQAERIKAELAKYSQTEEIGTLIEEKIAAENLSGFQSVETVPTQETAKSNNLYLYKNKDTGKYEIYTLIGGEIVRLDDDGGSVAQGDIATDEEVKEMLDEVFPQTVLQNE